MRILVFGDSITQGFWDTEGGWVARLNKHFSMQTLKNMDGDWLEVFNLGVSGDTTAGVIKRFENEVQARHLYEDEEILVFAIGTNDTILRAAETFSSPEEYMSELQSLFTLAKKFSDKILFVGMCGVDDKLGNPWQYSSSGKGWTNERIWQFEEALRNFCKQNNLVCIETFEAMNNRGNLFADGIHPSNEGHKIIADLVKPELEKLVKS